MSLAIVSINLGFNMRVGQLSILLFFGIVLLIDLKKNSINEPILFFLLFFGLLLTIVSFNSSYSKIDEIKFVIKYILIFPASFYIGQWAIRNLPIRKFLFAIETTMTLHIFMGFFLSIFPLSFLYNDRGANSGFQGTFLEAGWFSLVLGAFTLTSILLRLDYKLKFTKFHYTLYFLALISQFLSKNKTIWIALLAILIFLLIVKLFINDSPKIRYSISKLKKINPFNFILIFLLLLITISSVNFMLEKPIISSEMIDEKLRAERGKAFLVAIDILKNSDWLGAYGFGYIQQYFAVFTDDIIGLGAETSMLFNSYIDVWISVGILGLFYHFILLKLSFSKSHLFTLVIPFYFFIFCNTNPTMGMEDYYLFLGISYGLILKDKQQMRNFDQ